MGLYGNVSMPREWCERCQGFAFVLDGHLACCGCASVEPPRRFKRMSIPEFIRKQPSAVAQQRLLEEFGFSCAYCERPFGSQYMKDGKLLTLRLNWDHHVPYAYSANNNDENFLPACNVCNAWKSALVFQTVDEARVYLVNKWATNKRYEDE